MESALDIKNLNKSYKDFGVKNVSFSLPSGAIMGLVGPNGAGKTTIIKSILGLNRFEAGEVFIFGQNDSGLASEMLGVVTDNTLYDDEWKVIEIEKVMKLFCKNWNQDKYDGLLKQFGISKKKRVKELSRGMNVKLMIAVALSHDAKLLVLDEPTSGLDPVARDEICELLLEYARHGGSVLFSTHITEDLEKIADYITFVLNGEIVFSEQKEELGKKYQEASLSEIIVSVSKGGGKCA